MSMSKLEASDPLLDGRHKAHEHRPYTHVHVNGHKACQHEIMSKPKNTELAEPHQNRIAADGIHGIVSALSVWKNCYDHGGNPGHVAMPHNSTMDLTRFGNVMATHDQPVIQA